MLYNEPYRATRMAMAVSESAGEVAAEYSVWWGGRRHRLRAVGATPVLTPGPQSVEHFFKEHSWGYGVTRRGRLLRYEVSHPEWAVYPVRSYEVDVSWATLYGPEWGVMQGAVPESVVLAAGSKVHVYPKGVS